MIQNDFGFKMIAWQNDTVTTLHKEDNYKGRGRVWFFFISKYTGGYHF